MLNLFDHLIMEFTNEGAPKKKKLYQIWDIYTGAVKCLSARAKYNELYHWSSGGHWLETNTKILQTPQGITNIALGHYYAEAIVINITLGQTLDTPFTNKSLKNTFYFFDTPPLGEFELNNGLSL